MSRPVMLGNGSLTVGLNENGLVHDFYYPYVGLDNLTTARSVHHLIGVWVDGRFSWIDDGTWENHVDFEGDALVSKVSMTSKALAITLTFEDCVDTDANVFLRNGLAQNDAENEREIRVFIHQVFQISRSGRADTALFVPEMNYILDYKGRCSLLIYGQTADGQLYDQFAIGNYGIEGKQGTFKDAEDGELSGSVVEHGGVDSVIRFRLKLAGGASMGLAYWIVASDSQFSAEKIHKQILDQGITKRFEVVRGWWNKWLSTGVANAPTMLPERQSMLKKSLMVIKAHTDRRGGIIASCDSSIYNYGRDYYSYVWPRDGAYAIWPLLRLGYTQEAKNFFTFCQDIMAPDGYMMHKYQPDRAIGSTWHPLMHGRHAELAIQEDETAIIVYMLGEYYRYSQDADFVRNLYANFIQPMANFMCGYMDEATNLPHASYDLWEEKFLTHTYTTALVYQALLTAAEFAELFDFPDDAANWRQVAQKLLDNSVVFYDPDRHLLRKGFLLEEDGSLTFDNTLDISSLYGAEMFGYHIPDRPDLDDTLHAVEEILLDKSPAGGSPRYEYDHYFESQPAYMGNPWFVTTLWLAQFYIRRKQPERAEKLLDWTLQHALPSGVLSEQINPTDGKPLSVAPLVWSHAELINTLIDLGKVQTKKAQS